MAKFLWHHSGRLIPIPTPVLGGEEIQATVCGCSLAGAPPAAASATVACSATAGNLCFGTFDKAEDFATPFSSVSIGSLQFGSFVDSEKAHDAAAASNSASQQPEVFSPDVPCVTAAAKRDAAPGLVFGTVPDLLDGLGSGTQLAPAAGSSCAEEGSVASEPLSATYTARPAESGMSAHKLLAAAKLAVGSQKTAAGLLAQLGSGRYGAMPPAAPLAGSQQQQSEGQTAAAGQSGSGSSGGDCASPTDAPTRSSTSASSTGAFATAASSAAEVSMPPVFASMRNSQDGSRPLFEPHSGIRSPATTSSTAISAGAAASSGGATSGFSPPDLPAAAAAAAAEGEQLVTVPPHHLSSQLQLCLKHAYGSTASAEVVVQQAPPPYRTLKSVLSMSKAECRAWREQVERAWAAKLRNMPAYQRKGTPAGGSAYKSISGGGGSGSGSGGGGSGGGGSGSGGGGMTRSLSNCSSAGGGGSGSLVDSAGESRWEASSSSGGGWATTPRREASAATPRHGHGMPYTAQPQVPYTGLTVAPPSVQGYGAAPMSYMVPCVWLQPMSYVPTVPYGSYVYTYGYRN